MKNVLVGLKRVIDYNVRVRVKNDGSGVETEGVKMSINPFDEIALEEALRIKEKGLINEIIVISIGPSESQQQLRTGLAMGADKAILIETSADLDPLTISKVCYNIVERENPLLVLLGKQGIDNDNNQTGQMLATLWGRPQATFASKIELNEKKATVVREIDLGLETIEIDLPAVITTDLRLNEPRYVKLPDIMKAKNKSLEIIPFTDFKIEVKNTLKNINIEPPEKRQKGIMVNDSQELINVLKEKGLL